MADDVTLTIDGHTVQVPAGTTILKAAEKLGEPGKGPDVRARVVLFGDEDEDQAGGLVVGSLKVNPLP